MDDELKRLEQDAAKLGELAAEQEEATAAASRAEAELIKQIVELVKPALRALSSRVKVRERTWWPDSVSTATEEDFASWRGFRVSGDGPERDHPGANQGEIEGVDTFIKADGSLCRLRYSGDWTRWQGRAEEWTASEATITPLDLAREVGAEDIVKVLSEAVQRQLSSGGREKATARSRERAAVLGALSTMLERKLEDA